jgi:carbonic anhydrase
MVLQQLQNLRAHPFVRQREEQGDLRLHAWFYDMKTPEVYEWDQDAERFEPLHGQEVA